MPATAVGSANGMSTSASTTFFPKNSYRTSTHATMMPKKTLVSAARNDAPKLRRYDASARGAVTMCQNCSHESVLVFTNTPASGISTIKLR